MSNMLPLRDEAIDYADAFIAHLSASPDELAIALTLLLAACARMLGELRDESTLTVLRNAWHDAATVAHPEPDHALY